MIKGCNLVILYGYFLNSIKDIGKRMAIVVVYCCELNSVGIALNLSKTDCFFHDFKCIPASSSLRFPYIANITTRHQYQYKGKITEDISVLNLVV